MTTYDPAAPGYAGDATRTPQHYDLTDPTADPVDATFAAPSTLEELRAAVAEVEQVVEHEFSEHELFSPGEVIRLTCSTEIEHHDWKNMQIASMPRKERNKRLLDPKKVDEVHAFATLIAQQTTEIAIRKPDGYKPVDGSFSDVAVLGMFGVAEGQLAVREVFGRSDAYILHAGRELLEACGLGERKPGEEMDPT